MKRKLAFLLILAGIIGLGIGVYRYFAQSVPKEGVLKINATPTASIFIDNRHLGRTPYEDKVEEGDYEIKLIPETSVQSLSSWQGKIRVNSNLLTYVNADLAESEFNTAVDILWLEKISSKNSEISVVTTPDGAFVSVDGENKGISPLVLSDVSVGDHTISFSSAGFAPRTLKIKTTSGFRLFTSVRMALSPTDTNLSNIDQEIEATESAVIEDNKEEEEEEDEVNLTPTTTPKDISKTTLSPTPTETKDLPDPDKPFVIIKDTPIGYLRVRESSTTSSEEIGRVNPGEKYTILDSQNGWYKIKYEEETIGWISGNYTTKEE
ncbi:PEGA domain-containing protein [Patescibacteria group bacterium]